MSRERLGTLFGIAAYGLWGLFPLYWPLLAPASPVEILAHRVVWSLVVVLAILAVQRQWAWVRGYAQSPRRLGALALAAFSIAGNWWTYIYAVNSGHVIEISLGFFLNPLVTVLLGVLVLRERLRPVQWVAVGLSGMAVLVLIADYGRLPWIALLLAASFAMYGLLKKRVGAGAVEGLTIETAALMLPAIGYLAWLHADGDGTLGRISATHTLLLVGAGVVTAVPLLFFGAAANRIPLSRLGLLQYLAPSMTLLLGLLVFREPMPPSRLAGFMLIWIALIVFTADGLAHRRSLLLRTRIGET